MVSIFVQSVVDPISDDFLHISQYTGLSSPVTCHFQLSTMVPIAPRAFTPTVPSANATNSPLGGVISTALISYVIVA